jgi:hypothetical protein
MEDLQELLLELKKDVWSKATISLFIAKRSLKNRQAKYSIFQVNADESLREKLRTIAVNRINIANNATEYDFNTADLDNDMLGIESSETDFQGIIELMTDKEPAEFITEYNQLIDTWVYIARLDVKNKEPLYAVRRVSDAWSTKKVKQFVNALFQDNMLVDIKQENVFKIDGKIDFLSHQGTIFIADKKNFEAALNFRLGMEKIGKQLLKNLKIAIFLSMQMKLIS